MARDEDRKIQRMANEIMELLVTHHGGGLSEGELDRGIDSLHQAMEMARISHEGQFRKSGEPYFFHPLRVAHLAARHWMDFASVVAAILHDVVEDTPVTLGEVESAFGQETALLVHGLTKAADKNLSREALKAETYRKQLLVAIEDVRVLCLKFWDRMDNLQTIRALNPQKQSLIAEETRADLRASGPASGHGPGSLGDGRPFPHGPLSPTRATVPDRPQARAGGNRAAAAQDALGSPSHLRAPEDLRGAERPLAALFHRRRQISGAGFARPVHPGDPGRSDHGCLPRPGASAQPVSPHPRQVAGPPPCPVPVRLPGAENHRSGGRTPDAGGDHHPETGAVQRSRGCWPPDSNSARPISRS